MRQGAKLTRYLMTLALLVGCNESGRGASVAPAPVTVTGHVMTGGPVTQSTIDVYLVLPDSSLSHLVATKTGSSGAYSFTTDMNVVTGHALLITASGGQFVEDATGATATVPTFTVQTLSDPCPGLPAIVGDGAVLTIVNLTPLTTIAARRVAVLAARGPGMLGELEVIDVHEALTRALGLGSTDGPLDPRAVLPIDFASATGASQATADPFAPAALYGALLAGLSKSADQLNLAGGSLAFVDALGVDFEDGELDGESPRTSASDDPRSPVPLPGGAMLSTTAGTDDLNAATNAFLADPVHNLSGTTPASFEPR